MHTLFLFSINFNVCSHLKTFLYVETIKDYIYINRTLYYFVTFYSTIVMFELIHLIFELDPYYKMAVILNTVIADVAFTQ